MDVLSEVAIVATLLIIGGGLMYAEVFLPGLIAGTIGLVCLIVGVGLAFSYFGGGVGMLVLILVIVGLVILAYWWFTRFHTTKKGAAGPPSRKSGRSGSSHMREATFSQFTRFLRKLSR